MPTFNNPRQVIVTEDSSGALAVLAAVLVIAAVVSAEAVLIEQVIQGVLIIGITALAGSSAVLALVLRRTGVWVTWRPPVLSGRVGPGRSVDACSGHLSAAAGRAPGRAPGARRARNGTTGRNHHITPRRVTRRPHRRVIRRAPPGPHPSRGHRILPQ
jgi:hypothetical protein